MYNEKEVKDQIKNIFLDVFQNINENKVEPLGRSFVTKWCDHIIFLDEENEMRTMKVSDKDNVNFVIGEKGFIFES